MEVAMESHETGSLAPGQSVNLDTGEVVVAPPPKDADGNFVMPEKFAGKSAEDIAKAYVELEKMQSKPKAEPTPDAEAKPEDTATPDADAEKPAVTMPALPGVTPEQLQGFNQEFVQGGKLSDASYDALAKAGYTKELVDGYIAGKMAEAAQAAAPAAGISQADGDAIKAEIGGEQVWQKVAEWARANLDPAEVAKLNEDLKSPDVNSVKSTVSGLHARYVTSVGKDPNLLGGKTAAPAVTPFADYSEYKAAMADPQYRKSPAFREQVALRLKASKL